MRPRRESILAPSLCVIPSLLPSIELEAEVGASAPTSASVLPSPSPLKALRACPESLEGERGIKGVRVPVPIPLLKQSNPRLKPQDNQNPTPCSGGHSRLQRYTPSGRRASAASIADTSAIADSGVSSTATLALIPLSSFIKLMFRECSIGR